MVMEHQDKHTSRWAAIESIAPKIGSATQTLRNWIKRSEIDDGHKPSVTTDAAAKLKALERENKELRQANEIFARRPYISHRRSSTAHSRHDCFHHNAS